MSETQIYTRKVLFEEREAKKKRKRERANEAAREREGGRA